MTKDEKIAKCERDKMFYVCVRHYVKRGLPIETAVRIIELNESEGSLDRTYNIILDEIKNGSFIYENQK